MQTSSTSVSEPALLTVEQAATYLGASTVWAVRRLISLGKLSSVKVGKRMNIRRSELDRFIESRETRTRKAA